MPILTPMPMPIPPLARALRRLLLPALLLTVAPAAFAQYPAGAVVQPLPQAGDPAELLATALRTLAVEPNNLSALTAAGHNALVLGDPNAAVGFFGRAQEIAPNDGHVKAGLGSALIELEKPQEALRLFADATRLGVPDDEIAEDRGLAYDLTGDPRKAQRDYAIVLAAHPEDDVARRRLALSQGISGDKAAAIATLDPLIRKRDIAGWRAQTFVLAMNGDAKGASDITHIMLPQQADMLQPFLVRLSTLTPEQKARAVNFGEMPAAGHVYTPTELANTGTTPTYATSARPATAMPAPRAVPRAQVAARASDLAPIPASGGRPATTVPAVTPAPAQAAPVRPSPTLAASTPTPSPSATAPTPAPRREMASRDEIFALGEPTYHYAPLAATALTPSRPTSAPARTLAPTAAPVPTPQAGAPSAAQAMPTQVAQNAAVPAAAGTSASSDLPTPAAVGHYDLPHDVTHDDRRADPIRTAAVPPSATVPTGTAGMVGTPVVHGETAKVAETVRKPVRLAAADEPRQPKAVVDTDTAPADRKGSHARKAEVSKADAKTSDDDAVTTRKGGKGRHADTLAANDDGSDDATSRKGRKGAHDKRASTDDDDATGATGTKGRKGTHATKLADDDSGDGAGKSRKGAHGKKASDDSDAKSSKSAKKGDDKPAAERVFVQVAGGANKDDMDKAWAGLKKKAPDLMRGHTPQTTPLHATNRLLVGPFKSEDEAQAFVNKMAGKGLSGFTVKTAKGQKVEKVDSGQ